MFESGTAKWSGAEVDGVGWGWQGRTSCASWGGVGQSGVGGEELDGGWRHEV